MGQQYQCEPYQIVHQEWQRLIRSGVAKGCQGNSICQWIFYCWHLMHSLTLGRMFLLIPGHTYLAVSKGCVVEMVEDTASELGWYYLAYGTSRSISS